MEDSFIACCYYDTGLIKSYVNGFKFFEHLYVLSREIIWIIYLLKSFSNNGFVPPMTMFVAYEVSLSKFGS